MPTFNHQAVLNIYLILCHPDYTTGRMSRLAIDGFVSDRPSHATVNEESDVAQNGQQDLVTVLDKE